MADCYIEPWLRIEDLCSFSKYWSDSTTYKAFLVAKWFRCSSSQPSDAGSNPLHFFLFFPFFIIIFFSLHWFCVNIVAHPSPLNTINCLAKPVPPETMQMKSAIFDYDYQFYVVRGWKSHKMNLRRTRTCLGVLHNYYTTPMKGQWILSWASQLVVVAEAPQSQNIFCCMEPPPPPPSQNILFLHDVRGGGGGGGGGSSNHY